LEKQKHETMNTTLTNTNIDRLFEKQTERYHKYPNPTYKERLSNLRKLEKVVLENREAIQEAIHQDFKKAPTESDFTEILPTVLEIRHAIKKLKSWMKPKKVGMPLVLFGTSAKTITEPKGVCLIISPWNYPFLLAFSPLVYALAAGNNAIIKPSELTPNTSSLIKKMIGQTFEKDQVTVVEGAVEEATSLLEKPFNHIFFTGSPAVGKVVMKAASKHLTSVTLELGGKSPVIVDQTADVEDAAEKIAWGKLMNNGQTCISPDYLLVHKSVKSDLIKAIQDKVGKYYDPTEQGIEKSPDYCRMVNQKHFERVANLIGDALDKGAKMPLGGKTQGEENFIEPTLLDEVPAEAQIMEEEIFGPIMPILSFNTLEEAVQIIRKKAKPLSLYIFSRSKKNQKYLLKNTTAGGTTINDVILHIAHNDLPFGGVNNSGIGKTHGKYGYSEFSNERAVLKQRVGLTSVKPFYPPYNANVKKMIDLLLKWM